MKKLILICLFSGCASQQVDRKAEAVYPYHADGVICYGLAFKGVVVGSGGECVSMLVSAYMAGLQ